MKRSTKVIASVFALSGIMIALAVFLASPRFGKVLRGPYQISLYGLSHHRSGEFAFEAADDPARAFVRSAIEGGALDPHPLKWEYLGSVVDRTDSVALFAPGDDGLVYKRDRNYYRSRVRLSEFFDRVERTCILISAKRE